MLMDPTTAAVVLAGSSFVITVYHVFSTRAHQRLTTTPYVDVSIWLGENSISCKFHNSGYGAAFIDELCCGFDGHQVLLRNRDDFLSLAGLMQVQHLVSECRAPTENGAILPGESVSVIVIVSDDADDLRDALARMRSLSFSGSYSCLSKRKYTLSVSCNTDQSSS